MVVTLEGMARQLARGGRAEQITRHIREQILNGTLGHGYALPSTRQMAGDWRVSSKTIDAALAPLVAEGLVISRDRSGRVVNDPRRAADEPQRDTELDLTVRVRQLEAEVAELRARLDRL